MYDGYSAAAYADQYALSPSKWYPNFGDDCTNFVSQALFHGGLEKTWDTGVQPDNNLFWWEYRYVSDGSASYEWSHSWSVANDLQDYLMNSGRHLWDYGLYWGPDGNHDAWFTNIALHAFGDHGYDPHGAPIFYDWDNDGRWDHAGIAVAWGTDPASGARGTLQDEHTSNRKHVLWSLVPYNGDWQTTRIDVIHLVNSGV